MKANAAGIAASTRTALLAGVAMFTFAVPSVAMAQEEEAQPATDVPAEDMGQGNEIIVTATKREQTLQDVPVAVSVTTAETLERAQIRDIRDLTTVVPSLRVGQLQSSANTNFFIRGFGNGANNAGIEPSVGVFIDGVYRSRSAAQIGDFPDVQRIEVLRGPQSTLFGKNASAGVISIVTQLPKFTFGGNVEASYGNYDALVVKGMVTGPLSETIAASIAGGYNRRDGYNQDLGTGGTTNDRDRWFVRGQLLFEPTSQLRVRLIGDYGKMDENCCGVVNLQTSSATQALRLLGGLVNPANQPFGDVVYNNLPSSNQIENWGVSGQIDYELGPLTFTSITAYRGIGAITDQDSDFTSGDLIGRNWQDLDIKTFTQELRLATNLDGPFNALLGAFYFNERINQANQLSWGNDARRYANILMGGTPGTSDRVSYFEGLFGTLTGNPARYINQFFAANTGQNQAYTMSDDSFSIFGQVDFELADGLTLTGGINYTRDKKTFTANMVTNEVFSAIDLVAMRNAATNAGIAQAVGANFFSTPLATPQQIAFVAANYPTQFAAIQSGAAAATLPILGLTALQYMPQFLNVPNVVEPGKTDDDNVSYTARLAYDASDDINVYLSYATGFKASSINLSRDSRPAQEDAASIAPFAPVNLTYGSRFAGPETSTVYEAGLKADWGLATVNLAVFHQAIKGFQSNIFTGGGFFLANAGKQSTWGFEFEGMVRPTDGLTLSLGLTYLDPKYDSFQRSACGDATGQTPAGIPPISATFGAEYEHDFANGDRAIARVSYHYESDTQVTECLPGFVTKNPITGAVINYQTGVTAAQPFTRTVDEVDASLTYAMNNGIELSIWGRNLLNDRYIIQIFDSPAQPGSISGYPNQPRTYGGSVRFRW